MQKIKLTKLTIIYNLLNQSIKKGKKSVTEKNIRKSLYYLMQHNNDKSIFELIDYVTKNTEPLINFKKKKNFYKPTFINKKKKAFLACSWILNEVKNQSSNKFYKNLATEIININNNKSLSTKKRLEFHKEALDKLNIVIKKKKIKFSPVAQR